MSLLQRLLSDDSVLERAHSCKQFAIRDVGGLAGDPQRLPSSSTLILRRDRTGAVPQAHS
jgi:hypothetical protein